MKAAPFTYRAPTSVPDAVALLSELGDEAKIIAGGQSLVPMLALRLARPEHLVDLNRVDGLSGISVEDGHLVVGAMARHAVLERDPEVARAAPLLARAAPFIGHFQIRNRGTLGGSLAHADGAAEWPAVARALDAVIEVEGPSGPRRIDARDFFRTTFTTALDPDELVVAVRFPLWSPGAGFAIEELSRRHGDFAMAGAVCAVEVSGGRIDRVAIATIALADVPQRATHVERELLGRPVAELDLGDVAAQAVAPLDPPADAHATSAYRRRVGAVLVARALSAAIQEATHE